MIGLDKPLTSPLFMYHIQCVHMDILDWIAVKDVTDIAQTMNHVIMSVDCVKVDVRTGILEHIATAVRFI